MNAFFAVFSAINKSTLTPGQKLHAFALLELAPDGAHQLSWDEVRAATGMNSKGAIRKTLSTISAAGLMEYRTDGNVWVSFFGGSCLPLPVNGFTATGKHEDEDSQDALPLPVNGFTATGKHEDEDDNKKEGVYRQRRVGLPVAARGFTGSGKHEPHLRLVGIDHISTPCNDLDLKPNQPKPVSVGDIDRNLALLIDPEVGLGERQAERLAKAHTFDWLIRQVFAWREDLHQGKVNGPGALVARLDRAFAPGDITERDRASPLYQRHVSEEEQRAAVADKYTPSEYEELINS